MKKHDLKIIVSLLLVTLLAMQSSFSQSGLTGKSIYRVAKGDSVLAEYVVDSSEEVTVIVELTEMPLADYYGQGKLLKGVAPQIALAKIQSEQAQFRNALSDIDNRIMGSSSRSKVLHEYSRVVNAVAVTTVKARLDDIRALPNVRHIYPNVIYTTQDDESNAMIGAPSVWQNYGVTGKGILVGVIDTGIDYDHPALGGGIGSAYKVVGGYNFVTMTTDPKDISGHGTHVAGIIAGNGGGIKGVAPDAKLYAFKTGESSHSGHLILAAYDRCCDLDGDPNTDDKVDVINMSLGATFGGDEEDIVSKAITNATRSGVVVVIGAANDGPKSYSANHNANDDCITVGSVDKQKKVSQFSSRGPSRVNYSIQPDLVAPGETIYSSWLGGTFRTLDGTSMAAPHVAGACALLLEKYGSKTPSQIKSILMQSAKTVGAAILAEGAGLVNLTSAFELGMIAEPAKLNFGFVDTKSATWQKSTSISVHNLSAAARNVQVRLHEVPPAGVTIGFDKSALNLQAYGSADLAITLSVHNALFPIINEEVPLYANKIALLSDRDTVLIPFSFVKGNFLQIQFETEPNVVKVYNNSFTSLTYGSIGRFFRLPLQEGVYQVEVQDFGGSSLESHQTSYFFEDVPIQGLRQLAVGSELLTVKLGLQAVDEQGHALLGYTIGDPSPRSDGTNLPGTWRMVHLPTGISESLSGGLLQTQLRTNRVSSNYLIERKFFGTNNDRTKIYEFKDFARGLAADKITTFSSSDMKKIVFDYSRIATNTSLLFPVNYVGRQPFWAENDPPLRGALTQTFYLARLPYPNFGWQGSSCQTPPENFTRTYRYAGPPFGNTMDLLGKIPEEMIHETNNFVPISSDSLRFYDRTGCDPGTASSFVQFTLTCDTVRMALGPVHFSGEMNNLSDKLIFSSRAMRSGDDKPAWGHLYYFQMNDRIVHSDLGFELYNGSALVVKDELYKYSSNGTRIELPLASAGSYELRIPFVRYNIRNRAGSANAILRMNTGHTDKNPPVIKNLFVTSGGQNDDWIDRAAGGKLLVEIQDDVSLDRAELYYHGENDSTWVPLPTTVTSSTYVADITNQLPEGFISVKIVAADKAGNVLDYRLEPAFLLGRSSAPFSVALLSPVDSANSVPISTTFVWRGAGGTERYRIQVATDAGFLSLFADSSGLTAPSLVLTGFLNGTSYYWRVCAITNGISGDWSSARNFTTIGSLPRAPLSMEPADGSENRSTRAWATLKWCRISEASSYRVQISTNANFTANVRNVYPVNDTTFQVVALTENTRYYWRVAGENDGGIGPWSQAFSFLNVLGSPPAPILTSPAMEAVDVSVNPVLRWKKVSGASGYIVRWQPHQVGMSGSWSKEITDTSLIIGPLKPLTRYMWSVDPRNSYGNGSQAVGYFTTVDYTTSVEQSGAQIPTEFALGQNYPNPFNPSTKIPFALPKASYVSLKVFDLLGREVATLVSEEVGPGYFIATWQARVPSGTYIYRLHARSTERAPSEFLEAKRMILLR